jgi:hypothetical protein
MLVHIAEVLVFCMTAAVCVLHSTVKVLVPIATCTQLYAAHRETMTLYYCNNCLTACLESDSDSNIQRV